jgi:choline dehydrogenase-like flavoprotein
MFLDFRTIESGTVIEADLCVIGAGAAGITIARELLGGNLRVCLVESGGLDFEGDTQSLYEGKSVGLTMRNDRDDVAGSRLRFFGGTTNHWNGPGFNTVAGRFLRQS